MSVSGLCQVCESAEADHTCGRCGRLVCENHYEDGAGLCVECASSADPRGEQGSTVPEDAGDDVVQF